MAFVVLGTKPPDQPGELDAPDFEQLLAPRSQEASGERGSSIKLTASVSSAHHAPPDVALAIGFHRAHLGALGAQGPRIEVVAICDI